MLAEIKETTRFLQQAVDFTPKIGIILGTGLGGLVNEINVRKIFSYNEIPNFPVSTVEGHSGQLIMGVLGGKKVTALQGRFHYYEGYEMQQLIFPIRVLRKLGIKYLFLSNACGGVNPDFEIGDMMIIEDHISLFPSNPLIGPNIDELGPRFPDMSAPYSRELINKAKVIAKRNAINIKQGIYAGLTGPCLETLAEYVYVRNIGADAVGMSTVPEVIVARHMDVPCFAISIITDLGVPGKMEYVTHEHVQAVAADAEPKMSLIMRELIESM